MEFRADCPLTLPVGWYWCCNVPDMRGEGKIEGSGDAEGIAQAHTQIRLWEGGSQKETIFRGTVCGA